MIADELDAALGLSEDPETTSFWAGITGQKSNSETQLYMRNATITD